MILCYHKVHPIEKSIWWLSADAFYKQMSALRSRKVVYLDDYDPSDPDQVVVTFDGVYDNVLQYAVPILAHFGYPFELFIIGDYVGRENLFDQAVEPSCFFADLEMLEAMVRRGGRVQWHTRTHGRFSRLDHADQIHELTIPDDLSIRFPKPHLQWFAYPHGEVGPESRALVRQRFVGALACDDGDPTDHYYFPRQLVFEAHNFFKGRVSAIVANYNYGTFLAEAVDSLERQSVKPDEIIIIDDASTDGSAEILDQLEQRGYRVERNAVNLGIVENFRKAVALTSGDYVFFLGADNRVRRDFVLECRLALDANPQAAVAYTDMLLWGARSGELARAVGAAKIGHSSSENWDVYEWRVSDPTPEALAQFATHNFVHGSSMYRRAFYDAVGGYKKTDGPEDHHLFYRMWQANGQLLHVALPLLEYRQHSPGQANTVLGLRIENRALRERYELQVMSLREQIAANAQEHNRELGAERSLTHSLTGSNRELVAQLTESADQLRDNEVRWSAERERLSYALEASIAEERARSVELRNIQQNSFSKMDLLLNRLAERMDACRVSDGELSRLSDGLASLSSENYELRQQVLALQQKRNFARRLMKWARPSVLALLKDRGGKRLRPPSLTEAQLATGRTFFEPAWYAERHGTSSDADAAWQHFLAFGVATYDPSPFFDGVWYLRRYSDVAASGMGPFQHFVMHGAAEGRDPHPLFDGAWYRASYPEAAASDLTPFEHYLRYGAAAGYNPHPLFDGAWYRASYPEAAASDLTPFEHYLRYGAAAGYSPHPLFDGAWYLLRHGDVAASGADAFQHFVMHGLAEGRDPHPLFDGAWYRASYPEAAASDLTPFEHYLRYGAAAGYSPHPLFDGAWYLLRHGDVAASGADAFQHFVMHGLAEGRDPHPLFDGAWYLLRHSDVAASGMGPFQHFVMHGAAEGRDPHPLFDGAWYRASYPEAAASDLTPFEHYLRYGAAAGYNPHPLFDGAWYRASYPEAAASDLTPFEHYLRYGAAAGYNPHPLFDGAWYRASYPEAAASDLTPFEHYLRYGAAAGYSPHPLFDGAWYRASYPEAAASDLTPFEHYLRYGAAAGYSPHPLFDGAWYRASYPEAAASDLTPFEHYLRYGAAAGYNPHPLFDGAWYRASYPEAAASDLTPFEHYLRYGAAAGYSPHPLFDGAWYLLRHGDVAASGADAFQHFVMHGLAEGRDPHPLFDGAWYRASYSEAAASDLTPFEHYLRYGAAAGYNPNPLFDRAWYLEVYQQEMSVGIDPFIDFVSKGAMAGRQPNSVFRTDWYRDKYLHPTDGVDNSLSHALQHRPDHIAPDFDARIYRAQTGFRSKDAVSCLEQYIRLKPFQAVTSLAAIDRSQIGRLLGTELTLPRIRVAVGVVLYNEDPAEFERTLASIRKALSYCGHQIDGRIFLFDNSEVAIAPSVCADTSYFRSDCNRGFGAGHNALCQKAFDEEFGVYIGVNSDGFLHRAAISALLRMNCAQSSSALIEAIQIPEEHPKVYSIKTLETPWISCACFLMPRQIYEATGGFDENIFLYGEDVDLSWSARAAGFRTMICPSAMFFHDVSDRGYEAWRFREMLISGRYLGHKWGSETFSSWTEQELVRRNFVRHRDELPPYEDLLADSVESEVADFKHGFSFSPVRW